MIGLRHHVDFCIDFYDKNIVVNCLMVSLLVLLRWVYSRSFYSFWCINTPMVCTKHALKFYLAIIALSGSKSEATQKIPHMPLCRRTWLVIVVSLKELLHVKISSDENCLRFVSSPATCVPLFRFLSIWLGVTGDSFHFRRQNRSNTN